MTIPKVLQSSVNPSPSEFGLTVQGILVGIIPLAIFIGQQSGIELTYNELVVLVELLMGAISAVVIFIGAIRKIYVKVFDKK